MLTFGQLGNVDKTTSGPVLNVLRSFPGTLFLGTSRDAHPNSEILF